MPKARKYSHKRRNRCQNKTKRGGMENETSKAFPFIPMYNPETGKPKDTGKVTFYDISKGETPLKPKNIVAIPTATIEEVEEVFMKPNPDEQKKLDREALVNDYNVLMNKYPTIQDKSVELDNECPDGICKISGGRKSKRNRRKERKSRKHRRTRRH
jgi:hypothetical protein